MFFRLKVQTASGVRISIPILVFFLCSPHGMDRESFTFHKTGMFIRIFIKACHWPYPEPDQSSPKIRNFVTYQFATVLFNPRSLKQVFPCRISYSCPCIFTNPPVSAFFVDINLTMESTRCLKTSPKIYIKSYQPNAV
jgi:hypothetical protein